MNRRRTEASKLRAYMDGIKQAKSTTDAQWVSNWIQYDPCSKYISRLAWIEYLESCALIEASKLVDDINEAA